MHVLSTDWNRLQAEIKGNLTLSSHWHLIILHRAPSLKVGTRRTPTNNFLIHIRKIKIDFTIRNKEIHLKAAACIINFLFWSKFSDSLWSVKFWSKRDASFVVVADRWQWPFWAAQRRVCACGYNIRTWHASQWHHTSPPTLLRAALSVHRRRASRERRDDEDKKSAKTLR